MASFAIYRKNKDSIEDLLHTTIKFASLYQDYLSYYPEEIEISYDSGVIDELRDRNQVYDALSNILQVDQEIEVRKWFDTNYKRERYPSVPLTETVQDIYKQIRKYLPL